MKDNACTPDKNNITVVRSSSQEAAEQYERKTTIFATKYNTHFCIVNWLLEIYDVTWSESSYKSA